MALEPIKTSILQSPLAEKNPSQPKLGLYDVDNNSILSRDKKSDRSEEKQNERDNLRLSSDALSFLTGGSLSVNASVASGVSTQGLEDKALQFRGLAQIATRRELTDNEKDLLNNIRKDFAESGIDDKGILKLAQKKLIEIQTAAPDLVQLLNNQQITGSQFQQLNSINKLLNNSNGFGNEQVEGALQTRSSQLSQKFQEIVSQNENRKLTTDTISSLESIQRQLSEIQGYQLNVRDTVGRDGVVI